MPEPASTAEAARLDAIFSATHERFVMPEGIVYLGGNSLGPLTHAARDRIAQVAGPEWADRLISGRNDPGWLDLPQTTGDRIAALIGATAGTVVACDSTSVNLFKVLSAALSLRPGRCVVLSDTGNFPTDLYVAQGLLGGLGGTHELVTVEPGEVAAAVALHGNSLAALMLTEVDYRTGRMHDMSDLTARAHDAGALTIWDLSHSAGAVPVDLTAAGADFAVGCGHKYLNGGPGAPAFVYVRPNLADRIRPLLSGWMGHEAPFAFDPDYRPAPATGRMRVGGNPILALASLHAALEVWDGVALADVRARSIQLSESFIAEVEARCPGLVLASPRDPRARGSHVAFSHPDSPAVIRALVARGVIGDARGLDLMRFGFAPLYVTPADVARAADVLEEVVRDRS